MAYGIDEVNNHARAYSAAVNNNCDLALAKLEFEYKKAINKVENIRIVTLSGIESARDKHCNDIDPNGFSAATAKNSIELHNKICLEELEKIINIKE